jgi:hypothetical protein
MDKIYVGSGKESMYGMRIEVCLEQLQLYAEQNLKPSNNGKTYVKLDISKRKQPDNFGNTQAVSINTWKPEPKAETPF